MRPPNLTIRDYLVQEAQRITVEASLRAGSPGDWLASASDRRAQFLEMMGLDNLPAAVDHSPVLYQVTGIIERPGYRIEKLYYESLPQLYVAANLYLPDRPALGLRSDRLPAVLYTCGHSDTQKVHYQAHPRRFAELGFACLIVESVQLGEVRGSHHGCYYEGAFQWYSRGYTPAGIELLNGIRGLDLLSQRPEIDPDRLGATGISGGGATTWWVAAADERVKVAAPVCGTATLESHIKDRTIDGHCDCMWWINTAGWDLADVGALVAPRPLLIASADRDSIFTIDSIRQVHQQIQGVYHTLGAADNLKLVETPGGHSYHERSRTAIFSWFARHLQGREVPPEAVGDIDDRPEREESAETLQVFIGGPPPGDRTTRIQDELVTLAKPPVIASEADLKQERERVVTALQRSAFHTFPASSLPPDVEVEYEFTEGNSTGYRFGFTSEEGWRLHGRLSIPNAAARPSPVLVALRGPDEPRDAVQRLVGRISFQGARVMIEPRGTGETAWGQDLQWHLRRSAAWAGRTLASMRVYDVLRALEAIRSLPEVDGARIALAARGEMAAIALYAALLDGGIETLYLEDPPASQDEPGAGDGRGPAIEMLGCLKVTDLPQVAGLLYPTKLVFSGNRPASYQWTEDLHQKLEQARQSR